MPFASDKFFEDNNGIINDDILDNFINIKNNMKAFLENII